HTSEVLRNTGLKVQFIQSGLELLLAGVIFVLSQLPLRVERLQEVVGNDVIPAALELCIGPRKRVLTEAGAENAAGRKVLPKIADCRAGRVVKRIQARAQKVIKARSNSAVEIAECIGGLSSRIRQPRNKIGSCSGWVGVSGAAVPSTQKARIDAASPQRR